MSFIGSTLFAALLAGLSSQPSLFAQAAADSAPDATPPVSRQILPQIVRLSLVEGDVRVAAGKQDAKLTGNSWEHAAAGIPLASGFSLATGPDGRAEIEFEDTSTIYIAPNSALTFADLATKENVPHTSLALLSGTATLHLQPNVPGERYLVQTATYTITVGYGDSNYSRMTTYLDGLRVEPLQTRQFVINHVPRAVQPGESYDLIGESVRPSRTPPTPDLAGFDAWVANRLRFREAAMGSVMHEAGLTSPLPGLADLAGQGTFTSCAPYGTCWEPTNGWTRQASQPGDTARPAQPLPEAHSESRPARRAQTSAASSSGAAPFASGYDDLDDFPCDPARWWYLRGQLLLDPTAYYPYDWVVCHTGSWIYRDHRYHWVIGTRKHHHCPVHWIKYQGKLGYVPMHPRDQPGHAPVNLRHGVYTLTGHPDQPVERIAFDERSSPKVLDTTPKEFRSAAPALLARADSPQIAVHSIHEDPPSGSSGHITASTLTFNNHSQRFVLATQVTDSKGHTQTFTQPVSDRGGHITSGYSHSGGFTGSAGGHSGGFSGGSSGGGFHSSGGSSSSSSSSSSASAGGGGGSSGSHH